MKRLMIAGLLAAIGAVAFAGQSPAGNRYCSYYPEDPNCYEALYGAEGNANGVSEGGIDDEEFEGANRDNFHQAPPRPMVQLVKSCESVGRELRQFGYRQVRAVECGGKNYKFVAYLGYQRFLVKVNSRSGAIVHEINY